MPQDQTQRPAPPEPTPWISVVILNYNGANWLDRCLESIKAQTVFDRLQIIIADNVSTDGSDRLSERLITGWRNAVFIQNGCNRGFGAGSNSGVKHATGKYLFFLNPDVWLERECLERLYARAEATQAAAVGLVILEYEDERLQSAGGIGYDFCGYLVGADVSAMPEHPFSAAGFFFIRRDLFQLVGGYDEEFFLYGEELDLSWRVWLAGESIVNEPTARMHHRGAASENPKGGTRIVEFRTSESKRYYANRNHLLTILKNAQHVLLLLYIPAVTLMTIEGLAGAALLRRWSFFSRSCWAALVSCWRLRRHILVQRRRNRSLRKRSDFWLLRFFCWRFNRWGEYKKILQFGLPKVDPR